MKKIIAAAFALTFLGAAVADAAVVVRLGGHPRHHRHQVCHFRHHHRVCHWE